MHRTTIDNFNYVIVQIYLTAALWAHYIFAYKSFLYCTCDFICVNTLNNFCLCVCLSERCLIQSSRARILFVCVPTLIHKRLLTLAHCFSLIGATKIEHSPLERPSRACSITPPTRLTNDGASSTIKWRNELRPHQHWSAGGKERASTISMNLLVFNFQPAHVSNLNRIFGVEPIAACLQPLYGIESRR